MSLTIIRRRLAHNNLERALLVLTVGDSTGAMQEVQQVLAMLQEALATDVVRVHLPADLRVLAPLAPPQPLVPPSTVYTRFLCTSLSTPSLSHQHLLHAQSAAGARRAP